MFGACAPSSPSLAAAVTDCRCPHGSRTDPRRPVLSSLRGRRGRPVRVGERVRRSVPASRSTRSTNKVVGKTGIGTGSCGLGYGAGSLWIEDTSSSTVSRVSVATGKRMKAVMVGIQPYDTTFAYGSAWTTAYGQGELERIDPARNRVANRWKLPLATGVVGAFGSMWATGSDGVIRSRSRIASASSRGSRSSGGAGWTAASSDAVWVTTATGVARIDPQTNAVVTNVAIAGSPALGDPDVIGGKVWVPQIRKNSIAVVDPGDQLGRADGQGGHRAVRRHRDSR